MAGGGRDLKHGRERGARRNGIAAGGVESGTITVGGHVDGRGIRKGDSKEAVNAAGFEGAMGE